MGRAGCAVVSADGSFAGGVDGESAIWLRVGGAVFVRVDVVAEREETRINTNWHKGSRRGTSEYTEYTERSHELCEGTRI